jgi:glucose/arabinose dehydrogenase
MFRRQRMVFFSMTAILVILAAPSIPFFYSDIDNSAMGQESSSSGDVNNTSRANENTSDEVLNDTFQVLPDASPPMILDGSLKVEKVIEGLQSPTSMVFLDHDSLLILEKNGNVRYVSDGVLQPNPILTIPVKNASEQGLLGVAVANTNSDTKTVFLYYTAADGDHTNNGIYKFEWDGKGNITDGKLILELPGEPGPNHNGGKLKIGPDGMLYAVIGDLNRNGKLQNHKDGPAPDDTSVILRVDQDGKGVGNPLSNSFDLLGGDSNLTKYYAYGVRNSFGLDFDPITGTLWDLENGPTDYDEINVVQPGFNSGWDRVMGPIQLKGIAVDDLMQFEGSHYADPAFSWAQSRGVTDIEFLDSTRLGDRFAGNVFAGDITNGNLYFFTVNSDRTGLNLSGISGLEDLVADNLEESNAVTFGGGFNAITDIETGQDGYLYILTFNGNLYRLVPPTTNTGTNSTSLPAT